jgi:hypothetical protein
MDDPVFGTYVRVLRRLGISKSDGELGICTSCMPKYARMTQEHQKKTVLYGVLALVFAVLYLVLVRNVLVSLAIAALVFSFSLFSYCPPLEKDGATAGHESHHL